MRTEKVSHDMKAAYSFRFKVPFGDIDMMGHVNNAKYLSYFETARTEHLLSLGKKADREDLGIIIARIEIDYKSPVSWNEELVVKVRPSSIGRTSWVYDYEIFNESAQRVAAEGKSVQVSYDYSKHEKVEIPELLREKLQRDLDRTSP